MRQDTLFSLFLRQVYLQSDEAQIASELLQVKSLIKLFFFFFAFCDVCVLYDRNMALHHHKFLSTQRHAPWLLLLYKSFFFYTTLH